MIWTESVVKYFYLCCQVQEVLDHLNTLVYYDADNDTSFTHQSSVYMFYKSSLFFRST